MVRGGRRAQGGWCWRSSYTLCHDGGIPVEIDAVFGKDVLHSPRYDQTSCPPCILAAGNCGMPRKNMRVSRGFDIAHVLQRSMLDGIKPGLGRGGGRGRTDLADAKFQRFRREFAHQGPQLRHSGRLWPTSAIDRVWDSTASLVREKQEHYHNPQARPGPNIRVFRRLARGSRRCAHSYPDSPLGPRPRRIRSDPNSRAKRPPLNLAGSHSENDGIKPFLMRMSNATESDSQTRCCSLCPHENTRGIE